jgi:hypothetical protein
MAKTARLSTGPMTWPAGLPWKRDVYKVKGLGRENWEVKFCGCSLVKLFDVKVFENP